MSCWPNLQICVVFFFFALFGTFVLSVSGLFFVCCKTVVHDAVLSNHIPCLTFKNLYFQICHCLLKGNICETWLNRTLNIPKSCLHQLLLMFSLLMFSNFCQISDSSGYMYILSQLKYVFPYDPTFLFIFALETP